MHSKLLQPLLYRVWEAPAFGPEGFVMDAAGREAAAAQMAEVLVSFTADMKGYLAAGLPEMDERAREGMLRDMAAKTIAFSPGLSAGEINNTRLLRDMGVMTGITGVGNTLVDHGDPAMAPAILRLCGQEHGSTSEMADNRLALLRGIEHKARRIAAEGDEDRILSVVRDELMLHEVKAHRLSMAYLEAGREDDFWRQHAEEAAATLLTTAALPTATTPLYSIYSREFRQLPSLDEVYAEPTIGSLLVRANAVIRVQDDMGDRFRDARPKSFSLNLFNQPALVGPFCRQSGITDEVLISGLAQAFAGPATPERLEMIMTAFTRHFWDLYVRVPIRYQKYRQLVVRALAAGKANEAGDDALVET